MVDAEVFAIVLHTYPHLRSKETVPLVPSSLFFFSLILMIPELPAASYFADGLVISLDRLYRPRHPYCAIG